MTTRRLLRAELMRLRNDYLLLGFVALALVMSVLLVLSGSAGLDAGLTQVVIVAVLYGTIRYVRDLRDGVVARTILSGHRGPALAAKAVVTTVGGAVIGAVGGICTMITLGVAPDRVALAALSGATLCAAVSAILGLCVGVLVRDYFLAPLVAFLAHATSALVLASWPAVGQALPLGAATSVISGTRADLLTSPLSVVVLLTWLILLGTFALLALTARDVG
jgi:hypothetical protein